MRREQIGGAQERLQECRRGPADAYRDYQAVRATHATPRAAPVRVTPEMVRPAHAEAAGAVANVSQTQETE
jgi:hypothetical protein